MTARTFKSIMFQGTGSDVGKSLLVAGLARAFVRRGLRVAPFKPQNMSNNAAVCPGGGEIGRAQALQARACHLLPTTDMNPVLLKPQSDIGSQVIVQGKVFTTASAKDYYQLKKTLLPKVLESFTRLGEDVDLVLVEGAGSAAEVNLRAADIANMGFAEAADCPVVLIGDIDRGGVIASIIGTYSLISEAEKALVKGFLINKFRGDPSLFETANQIMERHTGWKNFGTVSFYDPARLLPAEDAMTLDQRQKVKTSDARRIKVVVPRLPRIANFDDLDPLLAEANVEVAFIEGGHPLPFDADVIILPGSKSTIADLQTFKERGWDIDLLAHIRQGTTVIGLCGGYQMLGRWVRDPDGIEGSVREIEGLGHLDIETTIQGPKTLCEIKGFDCQHHQPVVGYEMHMGISEGSDRARPWLELNGRGEGAISANGRVFGTYLHGIFAENNFRRAFLEAIRTGSASSLDFERQIDQILDGLADHLESCCNLDDLLAIAR